MTNMLDLENIATQVRRDIVRMTNAVNSGHPGGSLGCTEFMTALYFEIMEHNPEEFTMGGKNSDMFFLSNGHITPVLYSVMARRGYFPVKELATFRVFGTRLQGHPSTAHQLPGIRMASGSLGQGLSVAIGAAIAKKMENDNKLVYTLHGDGELEEGQIWEAAMYAGAKGVDNIIATIDCNGQQIDGTTDEVLSLGNLKAKWEAFGWRVIEVENGNNMQEMVSALNLAKSLAHKGMPIVILMKTEMGYGVDFMQGTNKYHGVAPSNSELEKALAQLKETLGDY
ncbi:MAG: transketolase [Bacteroidales bacterium]|nr:transketolase [Bacteroidales bacterium]